MISNFSPALEIGLAFGLLNTLVAFISIVVFFMAMGRFSPWCSLKSHRNFFYALIAVYFAFMGLYLVLAVSDISLSFPEIGVIGSLLLIPGGLVLFKVTSETLKCYRGELVAAKQH